MSNDNQIQIMDILSDYLAILEALTLMLIASYFIYRDQLKIMQILSISDQYRKTIFIYFLDLWIRIIQEIFVIIKFNQSSELINQTISITAQLESACRYGLYLFFYLSISKQLRKQYKVPEINGNKKGLYLKFFNIVNIGSYYVIISLGFKSFIDQQSPGGTQKSLLNLMKLSLGVLWSLSNMIYFLLHQPEESVFKFFVLFYAKFLKQSGIRFSKVNCNKLNVRAKSQFVVIRIYLTQYLFVFYQQFSLFIPITTIFFHMRQYNKKNIKN
ncbi:hypothetical protein pb186bvf_011646 [Paramecium bursaria]